MSSESLRVGDRTFNDTVALTADEIIEDFDPRPVADLAETDFEALFETGPELVVLGTGRHNLFPPRELVFAFARRGIGLEVMDTRAAARTFNVLAAEGRRLAAVLYL